MDKTYANQAMRLYKMTEDNPGFQQELEKSGFPTSAWIDAGVHMKIEHFRHAFKVYEELKRDQTIRRRGIVLKVLASTDLPDIKAPLPLLAPGLDAPLTVDTVCDYLHNRPVSTRKRQAPPPSSSSSSSSASSERPQKIHKKVDKDGELTALRLQNLELQLQLKEIATKDLEALVVDNQNILAAKEAELIATKRELAAMKIELGAAKSVLLATTDAWYESCTELAATRSELKHSVDNLRSKMERFLMANEDRNANLMPMVKPEPKTSTQYKVFDKKVLFKESMSAYRQGKHDKCDLTVSNESLFAYTAACKFTSGGKKDPALHQHVRKQLLQFFSNGAKFASPAAVVVQITAPGALSGQV